MSTPLPVRRRVAAPQEAFGTLLSSLCLPPAVPVVRAEPLHGTTAVLPHGPGPVRPVDEGSRALDYLLLAEVLRMRQILWAPLVYQPVLVTPDLLLARYVRRQRWVTRADGVIAAVAEGRAAAEVAARMQLYYAGLVGAALPACGGLVDVAA